MASASASASAAGAESSSEGPVLSLMNKRLRALRKKHNRITQMEEALDQGKSLNTEQLEVLRSKPAVLVLIDEYDKLRAPLAVAVQEELARLAPTPTPTATPAPPKDGEIAVEDLVGLLYFGRLFDVQPQSDFTATMLTRTHERGCCLTYDYVTDDPVELLGERDLDEISALGALVTSRPASSGVSHKNALRGCVEHARLWLERSDQSIHTGSSFTYAELREKLKKIMASDYYTTTPEMKAPDDVAAAAVGNYNKVCQVQVPEPTTVSAPAVQVNDEPVPYQHKVDTQDDFQETELPSDQLGSVDEPPKDEADLLDHSGDIISDQQEQQKSDEADEEQNLREAEQKEQQYISGRAYQNQRGGNRGGGGFGGRRGYPNGRGGRGFGRGGRGSYQNGQSQFFDPGYNPRNYYNNTRGRGGGRSGGFTMANNHGAAPHVGHVPANAE